MTHRLRHLILDLSTRCPGLVPAIAVAAFLWLAAPAAAQPAEPHAPAAAADTAHDAHAPADAVPAEGDHGEEHHGESLFSFLSRIANFLILAGGLVYLLRSPLGRYLDSRAEQIRADLVTAAETRLQAAAELKEIEARVKALPAEVDALKARGKHEVEAEQQRIRAATAAERERLLAQARREIDQQLQAARRSLKHEVADLAVGIARLRIIHEITDQDRARLTDRYVAQLKTAHD